MLCHVFADMTEITEMTNCSSVEFDRHGQSKNRR